MANVEKSNWCFVAFQDQYSGIESIVGGDQIRPYEILTNIAKLGHQVIIFELKNSHRKIDLDNSNISVLSVSEMGNPRKLSTLKKALKSAKNKSICQGKNKLCFYQQIPVGVVFRGGFVPMLVQPAIQLFGYAKLLGFTTWGSVHDLAPEHGIYAAKRSNLELSISEKLKYWMQMRLLCVQQSLLLKKLDFVTAVSNPMRCALIDRYNLDPKRLELFQSAYNPRFN